MTIVASAEASPKDDRRRGSGRLCKRPRRAAGLHCRHGGAGRSGRAAGGGPRSGRDRPRRGAGTGGDDRRGIPQARQSLVAWRSIPASWGLPTKRGRSSARAASSCRCGRSWEPRKARVISRSSWCTAGPSRASTCWCASELWLGCSRRVVMYDQRGHGESVGISNLGRGEEEDLLALIECLGSGPVVVAGYSLGARVAVAAAARSDRPARRRSSASWASASTAPSIRRCAGGFGA